jgi:hypothetical protein
VHAPYYPLKGPYSSSDPGTIRQHIQEMLACNVTILVRAHAVMSTVSLKPVIALLGLS